jgi:hypothetical protein
VDGNGEMVQGRLFEQPDQRGRKKKKEAKDPLSGSGTVEIGIGGAVTCSPPSRPGELHPEPLTEPDLNLSAYPARATLGRLPSSTDVEFLRLPVDSDQYG